MVLAHNINEGQRTQDIHISQDVTFDSMLLSPCTLQGLKDSGFSKPSPIQLHGIPLGKCGFDLLLEAKSGTGKTAVFSVIALEKLDLSKDLQVIILAPTREIAMQIFDVLKQIGARYKGLCIEVVMGGLSLKDDIEKFKKNVHIVVGSPGRLKHLIQDEYIDTTAVRLFILDEADKLMEKSFQADINYIHLELPRQKQVIMSSATYSESSKVFIKNYVQNAQHVCPDSSSILLGIEQKVTFVKNNSNIVKQTQHKFTELIKILSNRQFKQCLIFCNYQARVGEVHKMLTREKWPAEQLHGQQEQTERLGALKTLQEYKCRLLISTDLAARGIDASNVDLVINFEPPFEWQTYLHRIGRAGRFGSYGTAVTILSEGIEQNKFINLLNSIKLPFHLRHLWTNEEFSVDSNHFFNQVLHVDIENKFLNMENTSNPNVKQIYIKLWNVLIGDNKILNNVESFDNLYKSFSEQEGEIELFSDLLLSFSTTPHKEIDEANAFQQMSLLQLPLNEHFNITQGLMSSKNIECCPGDKSLKIQENCENGDSGETRGDNEGLAASTSSNSDNNIIIKLKHEEIQKKTENDIKSRIEVNYHRKKNGTFLSNINSANDLEIESEDICNRLADFGLPISFSSSKNRKSKNNSQNGFDNYHKFRKDMNSNPQYFKNNNEINDRSNQQESNRLSQVIRVKNKIGNVCGTSENTQKYTYQSYRPEVHISTAKYIKRGNVAMDNHKYLNLSKSLSHGSKNSTGYFNNQQYVDWYNKLKTRVKQVEFFIYFNEISKL